MLLREVGIKEVLDEVFLLDSFLFAQINPTDLQRSGKGNGLKLEGTKE